MRTDTVQPVTRDLHSVNRFGVGAGGAHRDEVGAVLKDLEALSMRIVQGLEDDTLRVREGRSDEGFAINAAVLFIVQDPPSAQMHLGPSLVFTRRSPRVRQAGDLCCPGGRSSGMDKWLGKLLLLPRMPLRAWCDRWPYWGQLTNEQRDALRYYLATALREAFEEMRLWPHEARFLGLLPPQPLLLQCRAMVPVVVRVGERRGFSPNWEVDEIVNVRVSDLLTAGNYARLRVSFERQGASEGPGDGGTKRLIDEGLREDVMCFRTDGGGVLWGATYRFTVQFLERVFGFTPPSDPAELVEKVIAQEYFGQL